MQVQDIYVYPVKSIGGIRHEKASALQRGFMFDRRWMLVDEDDKFISQRVEHKLALLQTELQLNTLSIFHKHNRDQRISFTINEPLKNDVKVSVWDDIVVGAHLSNDIDLWFSDYLEKTCKLVFMPENGIRPIDEKYAQNNEHVSFADAFPYLLISQASLDDLNSRLQNPVPMDRFRPNLVVADSEAFEEDSWDKIRIGEVYFKVAKPCVRCILTTVDQQTGSRGTEPLFTLSKYRTLDNKVLFGQNLIALNEGNVSVNDAVEIISYK